MIVHTLASKFEDGTFNPANLDDSVIVNYDEKANAQEDAGAVKVDNGDAKVPEPTASPSAPALDQIEGEIKVANTNDDANPLHSQVRLYRKLRASLLSSHCLMTG